MDSDQKLRTVQMAYAGALADSVLRLGREGVLAKVTEEKRNEQMQSGKAKAQQFGITTPAEVFRTISDLFDCAQWQLTKGANGFSAVAANCKLCGLARRLGAESPCHIYCLDPMEGMVKGINPDASFTVIETLWEGRKCQVEITS